MTFVDVSQMGMDDAASDMPSLYDSGLARRAFHQPDADVTYFYVCLDGLAETTLPRKLVGVEIEGGVGTSSDPYSVEVPGIVQYLSRFLESLIVMSATELFEDGVESELSIGVGSAIEAFGSVAVYALREIVGLDSIDSEAKGEILRQIGRVSGNTASQSRLRVLYDGLYSSDPRLRDAALLGLESMSDPRSVHALRYALSHEPIPDLRNDMQSLIDDLDVH